MALNGALPIPQDQNIRNKLAVQGMMERLAASTPADVAAVAEAIYANDAKWRGSHPLNAMTGPVAIAAEAWGPLLTAFSGLERRDEILVGGLYRDKHGKVWNQVACVGHYVGTFKADWLGIPATGQPVFIRYGEVHELEDGKIVRSSCLWDILDVIRQAGFWPLAPSWGTEGMWLGPITNDGIVLTKQDMDEGLASIAQTLAMQKALSDYNDQAGEGREGLIHMPQKAHWHEKMMWYGPSGIGTTRGLEGFVDFHQLPFRLTWPGRRGGQKLAEQNTSNDHGHYIQIGDGPYSVTGGWPSVVANHLGGGLLGSGPTGREIEMRVMDFYLHHEGKIRENWVPIDIIHILLQMGVDVMQRVRDQFGRNRLGLR